MRAVLAVLLLLLSVHAAGAQTADLERTLDQALAERRYMDFGRAVTQAGSSQAALRAATWMRERILAGGGGFLVGAYAATLWAVTGPPPKAAKVKETAGIMAVYLHGIVVLDGVKCADANSPAARLEHLTAELRPVLDYVASLPEDRRAFIAETAFRIEERLAPGRANDDWLCGAGLQAMTPAPQRGEALPAQPDQPGRTFKVEPEPVVTPVFRAPADWEPEQRARRAEFHAAMRAALLGKP